MHVQNPVHTGKRRIGFHMVPRIKEHTYGTEMEVSAESTGMDKMNKIWRKMGCFVQVIQIVNQALRNIMLMSSSVKVQRRICIFATSSVRSATKLSFFRSPSC